MDANNGRSGRGPRRARPGALAGVLLAATAGLPGASCSGSDGATAAWTTVVDTLPDGAVHVVHTPPEDPLATWTLETEFRIGALDGTGSDVFGDIRDLDVGPGARIAVLDGQAQELRLFGPDGQHLRTHGRKGGGPGEMQGANGVVWGPDGLIRVPDYQNERITLFHPDTGLVGSHSYRSAMIRWRWDGVVDEGGNAWAPHQLSPEDVAEGRAGGAAGDRPIVYVALAPDGTPGDTLVRPEQSPSDPDAGRWRVVSPGRALVMGVPNYPHAQYVLDPRRRVWSTVQGDPAYRLIRWTAAGDTALILEARRPPVSTDREHTDSLVSAWEAQIGESLDRSKIPDIAPAIEAFFFDDDGRVWVRPRVADPDSAAWLDAFDAETGAWLGTLVAPAALQADPPPVIRGDTLWGVVRDELEVPGVVRGTMVVSAPSTHSF